jgi:quercetin dioxygenase-like cupin family protein
MVSYTVADLDELDPRGPGGTVRLVRKALGARAFGFNYFEFPPHHVGHEHDETASGDEEVFFCVEGSGVLRIDGEEVELRAGRFVRIDPEATRCPVAGPDGMSFLMIGAPVDGQYEPPPWG